MILMQGKGVSKGVVKGPLRFVQRQDIPDIRKNAPDPETERARFRRAQAEAAVQLTSLAERCRDETGDESALLFETHAMFVEDEDFSECVRGMIYEEACTAEYAVLAAGEQFAAMFAAMDDAYMRARADDVRDVARRLANILTGAPERVVETGEPAVLAADDLAPSETVRLDRSRVLGFVTRGGSGSSHTAILARTMGIPAICGLGDSLKAEYEGRTVYMDGETGQAALDPDGETLADMEKKYLRQKAQKLLLESLKGKEDVTLDGVRIDVCCNIGSAEDVEAALENDAQGIGLFRSEFLYLASGGFPGEEEQFRIYSAVAAAMNGRRVVIRTLDVGADKQADYLGLAKEENPALGLRGVRVSLSRPEIFRTQLRALYRASAYGKIAIMFPMIASVWEVRECRRLCESVMAELDAEGVAFSRSTELGVMIETPASALIADALAREVDFFSVGTNDLTQYTLACDRQCGGLERFLDPHHPAVLRALKLAADAAHRAGIWIGVCGELAADLSLLPTFLAIGVDELSVSPGAVLPLRMEIRKSIARNCTLEKLEC